MDLQLISGDFFRNELSQQKKYLKKYFKTKFQIRFINYYLHFTDFHDFHPYLFYKGFTDHTGLPAGRRTMQVMVKRYLDLEAALKKANEEFDFDTLEKIHAGKYRVWLTAAEWTLRRLDKLKRANESNS